MSELPQFIRVRHGQVDQSHELTTGLSRFSPSIEFYHPTTRYTQDGYDTGIVDGSDETDYAAALKRFRASVDSVDWEDKKKIMELDTAHLYFGLFDGGGETNLVNPQTKYPLSQSAPIGEPVKGLPFRIQKLHFWGYQGDSSNSSLGFAGGPAAINGSYGGMANSVIKEFSFYALATSPVMVNNPPDIADPNGATLLCKNEYEEHENGVEKEWIKRFGSAADSTEAYESRVIIGGAPLTKIRVITGITYDCTTMELVYGSCDVYVGYPKSVYAKTTVMKTEVIEFLDPTKDDCGPSAAMAIKCGGLYANGKNCITGLIDDISDIKDDLTLIDDKLDELEYDIGTIQDDITGITDDIGAIEGQISDINGDIDGINGEISTIKGDITNIEGDITTINTNITNINGQISDMQEDISDALASLDCLCDTLTGITGANGSPLPDCCGGGTTTTPDPCELPPELAALADGTDYLVDTLGAFSCESGAMIKANWIDACENNELPVAWVVSGPATPEQCECLDSDPPAVIAGRWYQIQNSESTIYWISSEDLNTTHYDICPYSVLGFQDEPVGLEPDGFYKIRTWIDLESSPTIVVQSGSSIVTEWGASKFYFEIICGPMLTYEDAEACSEE